MLVNLEQLEKAHFPILVTLLGISILVKLEQLEKARSPILSSCEFSPNATVSNAEQKEKAYASILFTLLGIVYCVLVLPTGY